MFKPRSADYAARLPSTSEKSLAMELLAAPARYKVDNLAFNIDTRLSKCCQYERQG